MEICQISALNLLTLLRLIRTSNLNFNSLSLSKCFHYLWENPHFKLYVCACVHIMCVSSSLRFVCVFQDRKITGIMTEKVCRPVNYQTFFFLFLFVFFFLGGGGGGVVGEIENNTCLYIFGAKNINYWCCWVPGLLIMGESSWMHNDSSPLLF